ncbi:MAG: hypothetical protein R3C14_12880 [Caldilineaceae bacterium]
MSHLVSSPMSTYPLEKLLQLWRREELTVEQMVGHLLQHLAALETQGQALQRQVHGLEQTIKPLVQA